MTTTPPNNDSQESPPEDARELAASSEAPSLPPLPEMPVLPGERPTTSNDPNGPRRLYRSRDDEWIGGVAGGLAEYFDTDPTLVRVAMVILAIVTSGIAVIAYLVGWIIIPEAPRAAVSVGSGTITPEHPLSIPRSDRATEPPGRSSGASSWWSLGPCSCCANSI